MPTDVIMPQMGESIFEGTITKWLKKPGEQVERDEPLFEISTDKVDAEIPAPAAGVLKEIKVSEGATVQVNTVVGVIDEAGTAVAAAPQPAPAVTNVPPPAPGVSPPTQAQPQARAEQSAPAGQQPAAIETAAGASRPESVIEFPHEDEGEESERVRSSPLVRRMAREHDVDLRRISGTGLPAPQCCRSRCRR